MTPMRVKVRTTIACAYGVWHRDQIAELPDDMARALVESGQAVWVDPPKPPAPETTSLSDTAEHATLPPPRRRGPPSR